MKITRTWSYVLFCILSFMFMSCAQYSVGAQNSSIITPTMKPTAQNCPQAGSGRAALMPVLATSHQPAFVYSVRTEHGTLLQRYGIKSTQTRTLLRSNNTIYPLSISPDKQWILMSVLIKDYWALQLIRIDGMYQQTLYCTAEEMEISSALFSPDQSIAFVNSKVSQGSQALFLLDVKRGSVREVLSSQQAGYPAYQGLTSQRTSNRISLSTAPSLWASNKLHSLHPLSAYPSTQPLLLKLMKWESNKSLFLLGRVAASPSPAPVLYRLRDVTKGASQQKSNLEKLSSEQDQNCQEYDITADNQHLICSVYSTLGPAKQAEIDERPLSGGTYHIVYRGPTGKTISACAFSHTTLLFVLGEQTLWSVDTSGKNLHKLMNTSSSDDRLTIKNNRSSCTVADTFYALTLSRINGSGATQLMLSALDGYRITLRLTGDVQMVGWIEV